MKSLKMLLGTLCALAFTTGSMFAGAINDKCPVSGEDVDKDKNVEVSVSFCCENCKGKFDKAPADFFEKVSKAEEGKCPISGKDVDKDQTSTVTVGVCCGKCEKKVKEAPKDFITKVKATAKSE
jgi:YHS domain-containing protein